MDFNNLRSDHFLFLHVLRVSDRWLDIQRDVTIAHQTIAYYSHVQVHEGCVTFPFTQPVFYGFLKRSVVSSGSDFILFY